MADFDSAQACVAVIEKEIGPVDVLVNNAGITRDMTFKKMDKPNWDAVMVTNLDSVFNMTKPVCDGMAEMSLTAKTLHLGVPIVTAFHVTRMAALVLSIGPLFRLVRRLTSRP